ncbi:colanic acid biosynthesis acetyltransferase WcaF [Caulobacter sp. NIBR1757]|uniref:colanic acid biosynthesis acetyltransferase WcaF n=1 Tax=Caulobacter sp. NIBR1757 TaxID=3016000 RepID=UPI0022F03C6F|nr:colanic acid biosynthesis acetyltransferase WcaF [Caulobacter sp. NIBR1757]WGM40049.1 2,3,4,5-tetrahydropyridine-2,6-dicarboxylate N-acetyltransferase [Caulobacter sp. NIBR1757]
MTITPSAPPPSPLHRLAPPSLPDKLRRGLWGVVWLLLFRLSPVPLHAWRRLLLRLFGAQVGAGSAIYPGVRVWAPWNLSVGKGVTVGDGADLYCVARIAIEDGAIISQRAYLCSASHDVNSPSFDLVAGDITVGANAWVAAEAFVGAGVRLNQGVVVAARAVVTKDVEALNVVAGNPAKVISARSGNGKNTLKHL